MQNTSDLNLVPSYIKNMFCIVVILYWVQDKKYKIEP